MTCFQKLLNISVRIILISILVYLVSYFLSNKNKILNEKSLHNNIKENINNQNNKDIIFQEKNTTKS